MTSVAVSHDGHCLLASCMDGAARLLDKEGGDLLATYRGALFGPDPEVSSLHPLICALAELCSVQSTGYPARSHARGATALLLLTAQRSLLHDDGC